MRTRSLGLTLFTGLAIFVSACSGGGGATTAPSAAASAAPSQAASAAPSEAASTEPSAAAGVTCDKPLKVGLVTDVGRINDKGFNQSAYEGMEAAKAEAPTCFETQYIETTSQSDYAKNLAEFTDAGYDVVIGVGFLMSDPLGDAAKANPDTKFIGVDIIPNKGHDESWNTNGLSLFYAEDEAGYMAGVLAASLSTTDHIGVVGGLLVVPPVERFVEGYINGAKATKSGIKVDHVYTSSFTEPEQGKAAAQQMLDSGADVIFAAGGLTGNGALLAACAAKKLAIGVDTDQYETLPEAKPCLVSSATKNVKGSLTAALLRIAQGEFKAGTNLDNAKTDGVGLAPFHDNADKVSAEVQALLDKTKAGLSDGSIKTNVVVDGKTE
jgi:basic membrane protein A